MVAEIRLQETFWFCPRVRVLQCWLGECPIRGALGLRLRAPGRRPVIWLEMPCPVPGRKSARSMCDGPPSSSQDKNACYPAEYKGISQPVDFMLMSLLLIVGLNVALKGPVPLVGESKLSRESKMSRTDRENCKFVWNTHSKNQLI